MKRSETTTEPAGPRGRARARRDRAGPGRVEVDDDLAAARDPRRRAAGRAPGAATRVARRELDARAAAGFAGRRRVRLLRRRLDSRVDRQPAAGSLLAPAGGACDAGRRRRRGRRRDRRASGRHRRRRATVGQPRTTRGRSSRDAGGAAPGPAVRTATAGAVRTDPSRAGGRGCGCRAGTASRTRERRRAAKTAPGQREAPAGPQRQLCAEDRHDEGPRGLRSRRSRSPSRPAASCSAPSSARAARRRPRTLELSIPDARARRDPRPAHRPGDGRLAERGRGRHHQAVRLGPRTSSRTREAERAAAARRPRATPTATSPRPTRSGPSSTTPARRSRGRRRPSTTLPAGRASRRSSLQIHGSPNGDDDGNWSLGDAADDALGALKTVAGVMLVGAAIVVPIVALIALIAWLGVTLRRRRRESALDDWTSKTPSLARRLHRSLPPSAGRRPIGRVHPHVSGR